MTKEASDQAFAAFEEELDKAEDEQLKRFKKLVDRGFLEKTSTTLKSVLTKLKN